MARAAERLRFRSLRLVNLIIGKARVTDTLESFSMQRDYMFKRLYEPKAMSATMAPAGASSLCLEVCCTRGDDVSVMPDSLLIDRCIGNLIGMKLLKSPVEVKDAFIVEMPHAYPIYEKGFETYRQTLLSQISGMDNLITTGRQGLFLYHAMTNEIMSMADSVVDFLSRDREKESYVSPQTQWGHCFY
jgi:protoporphyrinogen oxidase